jgi:hypothetical protein
VKKTIIALLSVLLVAFGLLIFFGPTFLTYKDSPGRSDAVAFFMGDDFRTRERDEEKHLREGIILTCQRMRYGKTENEFE